MPVVIVEQSRLGGSVWGAYSPEIGVLRVSDPWSLWVWSELGPEKAQGGGSRVADWEGQALECPLEREEVVFWAWVELRSTWT